MGAQAASAVSVMIYLLRLALELLLEVLQKVGVEVLGEKGQPTIFVLNFHSN